MLIFLAWMHLNQLQSNRSALWPFKAPRSRMSRRGFFMVFCRAFQWRHGRLNVIILAMSQDKKEPRFVDVLRAKSANKEAIALQEIEGNPLDNDDLFFIEKAIKEKWDQDELDRQIRLHAKLDVE